MNSIQCIAASLVLLLFSATCLAQLQPLPTGHPTTQPVEPASRPAATTQALTEKLSVTEHQITLNGHPLKYKSTAGYMAVKDEAGKEKANFFFVAYEKIAEAPADAAARAITFVFNGGPGAAAVWLHLGCVGPYRIQLNNDAGDPPPPPYRLVENEGTWLDLGDLVFIDPVGTGYSRPAAGEKAEGFYGVKEDVASVADFIRLYTTRYERWTSPKFLAGESYGTTRAAALSDYLAERYGIALNGIILVSSVLEFQTIQAGNGNDLPYSLYLPTYTAIAWYHKKLAADLQTDLTRTLAESEQFALGDYTAALARGAGLPPDQRKAIIDKLARYTGLTPSFIGKADLRIGSDDFRKMLLDDQRRLLGRFDARITGDDPRPAVSLPEYDPALSQYLPVYAGTFNDYVRRELRYENDLSYEVLSNRVRPWNFGPGGEGYLNVADDLRSAIVKNPSLRVFFASGYFDLATPFLSHNYTIDHLGLSPALRGNITHSYYMGGHMMYHNRDVLLKLKEDVAGFMRAAAPSRAAATNP